FFPIIEMFDSAPLVPAPCRRAGRSYGFDADGRGRVTRWIVRDPARREATCFIGRGARERHATASTPPARVKFRRRDRAVRAHPLSARRAVPGGGPAVLPDVRRNPQVPGCRRSAALCSTGSDPRAQAPTATAGCRGLSRWERGDGRL